MLRRSTPGTMRPAGPRWRRRAYDVIFEADTPPGRAFDVVLILAILLSVASVLAESVMAIRAEYYELLRVAEWVFTGLFTVEYVARLAVVRRPGHYAKSFFGIVDLLAVLPTYLSILLPGTQYFLVVRMLRVLRVFRVLKLVTYLDEANILLLALRASRRKIEVFLFAVTTIVIIFGALMYVIEGAENGFTSIPRSVYWAIVTLTTVGYGDISPQTNLGQAISALIMIVGYGVIAVPTGIVTAELTRASQTSDAEAQRVAEAEERAGRDGGGQVSPPEAARRDAPAEHRGTDRRCDACGRAGHDGDARYCKHCGEALP